MKFENGIVVVVVVIVGAVVVVVLVEVDVGKGVTTIIGAALRPAVDATNDDVLVEEIVAVVAVVACYSFVRSVAISIKSGVKVAS